MVAFNTLIGKDATLEIEDVLGGMYTSLPIVGPLYESNFEGALYLKG